MGAITELEDALIRIKVLEQKVSDMETTMSAITIMAGPEHHIRLQEALKTKEDAPFLDPTSSD